MSNVIVKWNESRILGLSIPGKNALAFVMKPGVNLVPQNIWGECQKMKSVKAKLEAGSLELVEAKVTETPVKGPGGVVTQEVKVKVESKEPWKIEAKDAVQLVEETLDLDTLEAWLENESRDEVRAKLSNKIDLMKK